jgi:hypothetical protein
MEDGAAECQKFALDERKNRRPLRPLTTISQMVSRCTRAARRRGTDQPPSSEQARGLRFECGPARATRSKQDHPSIASCLDRSARRLSRASATRLSPVAVDDVRLRRRVLIGAADKRMLRRGEWFERASAGTAAAGTPCMMAPEDSKFSGAAVADPGGIRRSRSAVGGRAT